MWSATLESLIQAAREWWGHMIRKSRSTWLYKGNELANISFQNHETMTKLSKFHLESGDRIATTVLFSFLFFYLFFFSEKGKCICFQKHKYNVQKEAESSFALATPRIEARKREQTTTKEAKAGNKPTGRTEPKIRTTKTTSWASKKPKGLKQRGPNKRMIQKTKEKPQDRA